MKNIILLGGIVLLLLSSCNQPEKIKVPEEKDMAAYLLVYFKDSDHSLHMALSNDGYSFTDVNNGNPIISGDTIAEQKGIRDPHIMRGPNNMFYMAMTDLHIYAKREGLRKTEWERPKSEFDWGNNRGIVLMKSLDLIHWTHTVVNINETFEGYDSVGCVWAPQTIWDKRVNKPMIYYTMRFNTGINQLYYSYVNADFTKIETAPKLLFQYPKDSISYIDGDITEVNGNFHLFYVAHDGSAGIKQAVSNSINKGYKYDPKWYDFEKVSCEAPNVWKRIGENKWVLMYDVYGLHPANFGFCETSDFKTFTNIGRFNEGVMKATNFEIPKHGAVIQLTKIEAEKLKKYWATHF